MNREQTADLGSARASLAEAEKIYTRIRELSAKGYATRAQLDGAVAARDSAAAKVNSLQSRVSDRLMRASRLHSSRSRKGNHGTRRVKRARLGQRPSAALLTLPPARMVAKMRRFSLRI